MSPVINPKKDPAAYLEAYTGGIVKEDYVVDDDPLTGKWVIVNDPYWNAGQPGYSTVADPYIDRLTASPDFHIPLRKSAPSAGYRRHSVVDGVQSLGDVGVNQSTRTQLINNSRFPTQTFWPTTEGDYYWYVFSDRRLGDTVLNEFDPAHPYGDGSYQVVQFKTLKQGGGSDPIIHLDEWGDGYQLIYNFQQGVDRRSWFIPCAAGQFIRFRFEIKWSVDANIGFFSLWSDMHGTDKLLVGPIMSVPTLYANTGGPSANISCGPYGPLTGYLSGDLHREYANWQVLVAGPESDYSSKVVASFGSTLRGAWPLDEERKTTDISTAHNDAVATATGTVGAADGPGSLEATDLNFGGAQVAAPLAPFTNGQTLTLFGWAQRDDALSADTLVAGDVTNDGPALWITATTRMVRWRYRYNTGGALDWASAWPNDTGWHFWMAVIDEPGNDAKLYIDGKLITRTRDDALAETYAATAGSVVYGTGAGGFSGSMSHVGVANGDWSALAFPLYALAAGVTWSSNDQWLKDPVKPALNRKVKLMDFPTKTREARRSVQQPLGREDKVVVTDPARGAPGGDVAFRADDLPTLQALDALLAEQAPLLLQLPVDTNWTDTYMSLGDDTDEALDTKKKDSKMQKSLSWDEVKAPTGNLVSWE